MAKHTTEPMTDTRHDSPDAPPRDDDDPNAMPLPGARARILGSLSALEGTQACKLEHALGRMACADIVADVRVPPFRASAMDGYAFRHGDTGDTRTITGRSLAGHPGPDTLANGTCQRITTGARVPDEADTVVQQEDTARDGDTLRIVEQPAPGLNVRDAGSASDIGTVLMRAGERVGAAALAVLASHGMTSVNVLRRVRVGVLSTGDELAEPGNTLAHGQIHDANRALLIALLGAPHVETIDLGIVRDSPDALAQRLDEARDCDVVITSGGVSVGDADHVRDTLAAAGEVSLWKIAMKPGRPLAFGRLQDGRTWFGLPGNPVSAAVTSLFLVRPALVVLGGGTEPGWPLSLEATLSARIEKRPGRVEYQRGQLVREADGALHVSAVGAQDSHVLRSLQRANCLIELPSVNAGAMVGDRVSVLPYAVFAESPL